MVRRNLAAAGVLVVWWCSAASLAAIPQQPGTMTQQQYMKVRASAWRQLLLIQYDGIVAQRGPWPWTPPQQAFLEGIADQLAGESSFVRGHRKRAGLAAPRRAGRCAGRGGRRSASDHPLFLRPHASGTRQAPRGAG